MPRVLVSTSASAFRLPSGPRTPKLVNGLLAIFVPEWFVRQIQARHGDAFTIDVPGLGRSVVVTTPDLVKQVYTAPPAVLHGGKNPLGQVLGPGSLFSMDEERHLAERRLLLPPFHGERMRSYDGLIEEETLRAVAAWPEGREFPTLRTFQKITLRVILRAVFGAEGAQLTELERQLPRMAVLGQPLVTLPWLRRDLGPWSPGHHYARMRRRYDEQVDALIDAHLADPDLAERIDILALMLTALRESGEEIRRTDIADELLTLLLAGHETTAASLAWTVERLRRHPDVLAELEREAAGTESTLRAATILEVQRTRPVIAATGRMVMQPFELGPWRLPPGIRLVTQAPALHADERFHHAADRFDPQRYVGEKQPDDAGADRSGEAGRRAVRMPATYAWIPFGGGVRRCLGASFALFEMEVVLRTLLRRFELLPTDAPPERLRFRGVAFAPARGGRAAVRRRAEPLGAGQDETELAAGCPVAHGA